jgi:hypothetical protein
MSQRLPAVRLMPCATIETQRKNAAAIHTSAAHRNAGLPSRLGPHADLTDQWQISLTARLPAQRRLANKQSLVSCANLERGLFKNAAHPPVDGFISRSQNQKPSSIFWN